MPSASHPTSEVIAFHAPVVEAGVLRQVVHTDTGLRQIVAPLAVWKAGIESIAQAIRTAPTGRKFARRANLKPLAPRAPVTKSGGRLL